MWCYITNLLRIKRKKKQDSGDEIHNTCTYFNQKSSKGFVKQTSTGFYWVSSHPGSQL